MTTATATLTSAIEQVGKVLALEEKQGHRDRAVVGGIASFAWQGLAPLRGSLPTRAADDSLARIGALLRDYADLAPEARQSQLGAALEELRNLYRIVQRLGENDPVAQPRYIGPPANRRPKPAPPPAPAAPPAAKSKPASSRPPLTPDSPVTDLPSVGD